VLLWLASSRKPSDKKSTHTENYQFSEFER